MSNTIIKLKYGGQIETQTYWILNVFKIEINEEYMSLDCYNESNQMIATIYYTKTKEYIYCEVFDENGLMTLNSIDLANNGELTYKEG